MNPLAYCHFSLNFGTCLFHNSVFGHNPTPKLTVKSFFLLLDGFMDSFDFVFTLMLSNHCRSHLMSQLFSKFWTNQILRYIPQQIKITFSDSESSLCFYTGLFVEIVRFSQWSMLTTAVTSSWLPQSWHLSDIHVYHLQLKLFFYLSWNECESRLDFYLSWNIIWIKPTRNLLEHQV